MNVLNLPQVVLTAARRTKLGLLTLAVGAGCSSGGSLSVAETIADPRGPDLAERHVLTIDKREKTVMEAETALEARRAGLETAENALEKTQAKVESVESDLEAAEVALEHTAEKENATPEQIAADKQDVKMAEAKLEQSKLELPYREQMLELAQARLEEAEAAVLTAKAEFELAKLRAQLPGEGEARTPDQAERLAAFQEQAASANERLAGARRAVQEEEEEAEEAKDELADN